MQSINYKANRREYLWNISMRRDFLTNYNNKIYKFLVSKYISSSLIIILVNHYPVAKTSESLKGIFNSDSFKTNHPSVTKFSRSSYTMCVKTASSYSF